MRPRSSTRGALVLLLLLFAVLGTTRRARAEAPDRCQEDRACKELTERAAQLASQSLYEEALTLYQSGYDRTKEPRLLVNIGRCHYRLGRARKALESYKLFQKAEPEPEPELAARLQQFLTEANRAIASDSEGHNPGQSGAAGAPKETKVDLVVPSTAAATEEPPPAGSTLPAGTRLIGGRPVYRIVLGASLIGVGGILAGLGAGAISANGTCLTPSASSMGQCALLTNMDGTPYTRVTDGITPGVPMLVIGVALVAGGIAVIAVPPRKPRAEIGK